LARFAAYSTARRLLPGVDGISDFDALPSGDLR
jgi:hypothetical protein